MKFQLGVEVWLNIERINAVTSVACRQTKRPDSTWNVSLVYRKRETMLEVTNSQEW